MEQKTIQRTPQLEQEGRGVGGGEGIVTEKETLWRTIYHVSSKFKCKC